MFGSEEELYYVVVRGWMCFVVVYGFYFVEEFFGEFDVVDVVESIDNCIISD